MHCKRVRKVDHKGTETYAILVFSSFHMTNRLSYLLIVFESNSLLRQILQNPKLDAYKRDTDEDVRVGSEDE